jgi:hypothetical protein
MEINSKIQTPLWFGGCLAEDVYLYKKWVDGTFVEDNELPCCDYCGGDRERALLSTIGDHRLCESCATLSVEERNEVKNSQLEECPDSKEERNEVENSQLEECPDSKEERNEVENSQLEECPDSKYEGSLWEYCEEGFRVSWDGHQWNARCTNQRAIYISIFEDVDPVAMEIEGFWNIIEYGGCTSTHENPKPLKRNPNKAPKIKVPWDPYTV